MKKHLHFILVGICLLSIGKISAQQVLPEAAYGFELTSGIEYKDADKVKQTGNIVEAWTQVAGFVQSSDQANTGSYSMKIDVVTAVASGKIPKLQTYRSLTNEGDFITEAAPYELKLWVYIVGDNAGSIKVAFNTQTGAPSTTFDLTGVEKDKWVQLTAPNILNAEVAVENWVSLSLPALPGAPVAGSMLYIDDITLTKTTANTIETKRLSSVKTYPNPAISSLNVEAPSGAQVEICNVAGAVVKYFMAEEAVTNVPVSDFVKGMYLVKVTADGETAVKKVLVK